MTIENINNGINILFNDSIQTTSRTTNTTFTIPIVFAVTYGSDTTNFNKDLTVTNLYTVPSFQTITSPEITKQTGQQITLTLEHNDTIFANLSLTSVAFNLNSNYNGSVTSSLQSVSAYQSSLIVGFTLDQTDFGTKTLDISLNDTAESQIISKSLPIILNTPYVEVEYSQSHQNILEFTEDSGTYTLNFKHQATSSSNLINATTEIINLNANDTVFMDVSGGSYELNKEYDSNSNLYFTLFNFTNTKALFLCCNSQCTIKLVDCF